MSGPVGGAGDGGRTGTGDPHAPGNGCGKGGVGITLVMAAHGRPALAALHRSLHEAKEAGPLAPATVLVPNNFVGIAARRALASGELGPVSGTLPGLAGVDFLTIYRLAELLGASNLAAAGRRPVSTPVIAAAVRQALRDAPGVFDAVAQHPTTERRLVEAHRELSDLGARQLDELAAHGPRPRDVVAVHRRVQSSLRAQWYGEQELVAAATSAVNASGTDLTRLGTTVLYLPEELSPGRAGLVRALSEQVPVTVIAASTGTDDADATLHTSLGRLGLRPSTVPVPPLPQFDVSSASDADDEVRHVARGIVDAARRGISFDRMGVFYASRQPYARLLHDHLGAADIPFNGASIASLAESTAGRVLLRLLSLSDRDLRREDVMALLATSPIRWRGRLVPSRAWDQISREAGIVKGSSDWDQRLVAFATDRHTEIDRLGEDPEYEWRVRRLARQAALAEDLRAFMADLVTELERGRHLTRWAALARWAKGLLRRYLGDQRRWPDEQRTAADRVDAVLERLAALDAVEPQTASPIFKRTLDLELEGGLGRVGSFGNGVLIGPAWMATGVEFDEVWVVGLSEGTFPSRQRDDSLLPDRERASTGVLALRSDRTGHEHRQFLAALASVGPNGTAHLLRPRGDLRRSDERAPSRWLVDVVRERLGRAVQAPELETLHEPWLRHVPSFAGGVLACPFPATGQEFDLRDLVEHLERTGDVQDHPAVASGALTPGAMLQQGRNSTTFSRFDGNLGAVDLPRLTSSARPTSATALETWARCPQQYFMRYLLRVDPLDAPEQRLRIDPISKGSLVHAILERFVQARIDAASGDHSLGWTRADRALLHDIASEEFAAANRRGITGQPLYWRRDQVLLRRDLDEFLTRDTERRHDQRLAPLATELGFGLGGTPPIHVTLPSGDRMALRGSIDLVDESDNGSLVLVDYKTGRDTKLTPDAPHKGGTKLQLVLYALAAREVLDRPGVAITSLYWHITARSRYRQIGYEVTQEIENMTLGAVQLIVDNIHEGVFPQHPEETTRTQFVSCHYCDPDGLGTNDARRRFVRKASDPALEEYLVLAEPTLVAPAGLPELDHGVP